jgi:hypothetical protein
LAFAIALFVVAQAWDVLACVNDTDCGAACGSMVCSFVGTPHCVAASTGDPGWCTGNAGCQCPGAICSGTYCSYTMPVDMAGGQMDMLPLDDLGPAPTDLSTAAKPDLATAAHADLAVGAPDLAQPTGPGPMMSSSSSSGCAFGGADLPAGLALLFGSLLVGALVLRRRRG